MDPLCLQLALGRHLEHLIRHAVRAESRLITARARQEFIRPPTIDPVNQTHELRRGIPVIILEKIKQALGKRSKKMQGRCHKWLTGGLNVCDAISHLGLKIRKSASGVPGVFDFAVNTQKIDGSM